MTGKGGKVNPTTSTRQSTKTEKFDIDKYTGTSGDAQRLMILKLMGRVPGMTYERARRITAGSGGKDAGSVAARRREGTFTSDAMKAKLSPTKKKSVGKMAKKIRAQNSSLTVKQSRKRAKKRLGL